MTDTKYNGWTNWETWLTNLHFDDSFTDAAQEHYNEATKDETFTREENAALSLAEFIKEYVGSVLDEYEGGKNLFLSDIVGGFSSSVNWYEIAKNYISEVDKSKEAA